MAVQEIRRLYRDQVEPDLRWLLLALSGILVRLAGMVFNKDLWPKWVVTSSHGH